MADRIIKGDSGNDVVIQNNAGSRKIEVTNSGDIEVTGDVKTTTVKATNLKANDGTAGLVIADSTGRISVSEKIETDDILEKTSAHGVEIDGLLIKDSSIASGSIADAVTQPDAYYVQGKVYANDDIGTSSGEMLNLNGTTAPYVTWTGKTTSFGDGSSKVTGTNDYDFKFIQKGVYFISFSLSGAAMGSNYHEGIYCQIRGGSSSHSTTKLVEANDGIQVGDSSRNDFGGCTATLVKQFNANDLINFFVDSDSQDGFRLLEASHISIFLIRALA